MSFHAIDRTILSIMERTATVGRRQLSHLAGVSPMTVSRAVDRLLRAGILTELHERDSVGGRQGRILTLRPDSPLLWLDLSRPHTSITALLVDSLLRPLCRLERLYSPLHSDEDHLRLLLNDLCRHPVAARYLATTNRPWGIAATPLSDGPDSLAPLRGVIDEYLPMHHLTVVSTEEAIRGACLHAAPLNCPRLLVIHTDGVPHAATWRIERTAHGEVHALSEDESVLSDTLARYLQDGASDAVACFVQDYRRFHAPTPTVWVGNTRTRDGMDIEDTVALLSDDALSRGSLLIARRALWADVMEHNR